MEEGKLETKPDIKKVTLSDGIERGYIDSYEKLKCIVDERFTMQKKSYPNDELTIDLSKLVICIEKGLRLSEFSIGKLCGKIRGIANRCDGHDLFSDKRDLILVMHEIKFQVKYKINFASSIIYHVNFSNTNFLNDVIFHDAQLVGSSNFSSSVFNKKMTLRSLKCKERCKNINKIHFNVYDRNLFLDYISEKSNINIKNTINISDSIFDDDVCFSSKIYFVEKNNEFDFKSEYNLLSDICLNGSHFNKKFKINNVTIGEISMQNCHFEDTVNISNNKYNTLSGLDFSYSTINSLFFIDSDLGDDKGEPIKLEKEICFSKSLITKNALIFLRNINNGNDAKKQGCLNFEYANILGTVTVQDSKLDSIKLDKSTLIGDINIENVETDYDSRESIAKVKNSYLKRNDVVNSLAYKAKEMKYYSEHLNFKSPYINKVLGWSKKNRVYNMLAFCILPLLLLLALLYLFSGILFDRRRKCTEGEDTEKEENMEKHVQEKDTLEEYVLLNLNRISNSFGMSWGRGVLFTCVTALLFFILINYLGMPAPFSENIPKGETCFGYLWENYLNMFYLLDFKEKFSKGIILNPFGETLFFVSKIFVSYGIYQTISAFRKYGK